MAIQFPSNPSVNDTYVVGGTTYTWNGSSWESSITSAAFDLTGNVTGNVTGNITGDVTGSVFADDSTLLVDGVSGTINATALTGALPAIDGSALTGVVLDNTDLSGNFVGSVFADDSTLLVDGVNGTINAANLTGALPALDGSALTGILTDGANISGNFTGSVFADDSTQIIDGITGEVTGNVNNTTTTSTTIETTQISGVASSNITVNNGADFSSDVSISGQLSVPNIITPDSSALRIENIANFQSDAIVDGRLSVGGRDIENLIGDGTGGYEFTGGFENRTTGQAGASDIGTDVEYNATQVASREWMRFGFSYERHLANDKPYWNNQEDNADEAPGAIYGADANNLPDGFFMDGATARPEAYRGVGLFSGAYMPTGVTSLFDFAEDSTFSPYNQAQTSGDLLYNAASGSYDMSQLNTGDFCSFRFDFNLTPQFANTTVEVGLIWQTRDANDNATFTFALTGEPIFFGAGTTGRTFLNRPIITAYLASIEDVNARALPAIRADQPVFVQPLTTLFVVGR